MRRILVLLFSGLFIISACGNQASYGSVTDGLLSMAAIDTKKKGVVKVRLSIDRYEEGFDVERFVKKMQYNADSCFYLLQSDKKIYPDYVMPIANGMDKTFEYLIRFEGVVLSQGFLAFEDLHRSNKKLKLTFK